MGGMDLRRVLGALVALLACAATAVPARAHPHVWIVFETTVLYEKGAFVGLRHKWTFDEFYAATAIEGLDKNKDGKYDREELAELAKVNIDGLKEFGYFTFPALAGQELKLGEAQDYWLEYVDEKLSLLFTVPFAQPVLAEAKGLTFSVHDPSFFIAFEPAKQDPVKLSQGAPKGCKVGIGKAPEDAAATDALQKQLGAFATMSSKTIAVSCSGP
jgi:ABC-type uncharacterized transport system substrate-binding protein